MRYLTEHELPPTPEYYRQAWRALGGSVAHTALGPLLAEAVRQLDVVHRHWTLARKKQALVRVLGSADDELLGVRLRSLVESWRRAPDDTAVETESGAAHAAGVPPALAGLSALLTAVCETVPRLVEEQVWVRQQFDAIRANLGSIQRPPDPRDLEQARLLLRRAAEDHERLLKLRRDSLQMMKTMIAQCIEWLRGLAASSERFGDRLSAHIGRIELSGDMPTLAATLRALIDDARSMQLEIVSSKRDFDRNRRTGGPPRKGGRATGWRTAFCRGPGGDRPPDPSAQPTRARTENSRRADRLRSPRSPVGARADRRRRFQEDERRLRASGG